MIQKHFMDIENLREESTELRESNALGFKSGDIIQITEKVDGANACVAYDTETDSLVAFSRKQELNFNNTLSGFWNYVQMLNPAPFKQYPNYRFFGEWLLKNKIVYSQENAYKWYVYDIYDVEAEKWLPQDIVKAFCDQFDLTYVHVLYEGPFVSWDHCKSFMNSPAYGDRQEGIVVKNQTTLNNPYSRTPFYLKVVNEDFKERMAHKEKVLDPEAEKAKTEAQAMVEGIITKNRVEKELLKMRDEGIVPEKISPADMKLVAKTLPKRMFDDCMKEDREVVEACGEYFGKMCSALSMKYAREVILGE